MKTNEKIEQLQKEIHDLQKIIAGKQKEADSNRHIIKDMYRMSDLLQSYIPERGNWRDAHNWRLN